MAHSWDEIKQAVERNEDAQMDRWLEEQEVADGHVAHRLYLVQRTRPYLEFLGGMIVGLHVALATLMFNYLLFAWILHVNFDS